MLKRIARVLLVIGVAALPIIFYACGRRAPQPLDYTGYLPGPPELRVGLLNGDEQVVIAADADFELRDAGSGNLVSSGNALQPARVTAANNELLIDGTQTGASELKLTTMASGTLRVNGNRYRGTIELYTSPGDRIAVVESVDIESYLGGVISQEVFTTWPRAALEAQAVAARTYALYRVKTRGPGEIYDFLAGHKYSQEYGGVEAESNLTRSVVDSTRGIILTYQWKIFPAYYSSVCGGHTRSVQAVFGEPEIMPLSGVPCDFCRDAKDYRWSTAILGSTISKALAEAGQGVGDMEDITPADSAGFWLTVRGTEGSRQIRAQDLRLIVGSKTIKSPEFKVNRQGADFYLEGRGFGHGVGMCQWGAEGMARRGYSSGEILTYYYPGAELVRVY